MGRIDCPMGLLLLVLISVFQDGISASSSNPRQEDSPPSSASNVCQDIARAIAVVRGWNPDDVRISSIDLENAKLTKTSVYDLNVKIGELVFPAEFTEARTTWQRLSDLDESHAEAEQGEAVTDFWSAELSGPVLTKFQLAGPVKLHSQDAEESHTSFLDEDNSGDLTKVALADETLITIDGAQELSLINAAQLRLPLNRSKHDGNLAGSSLALTACIRQDLKGEERTKLSLCFVIPQVLIATGAGELLLTIWEIKSKHFDIEAAKSPHHLVEGKQGMGQTKALSVRGLNDTWICPFPCGSCTKFSYLEEVLKVYKESEASGKGSFIVHKVMEPETFVRFEFELERKLGNESFDSGLWPEWKTRPSAERKRFEVLAKVQGRNLVPVVVRQLKSYGKVETYTWSELTSNVSFTSFSSLLLPSSPMTLDLNW